LPHFGFVSSVVHAYRQWNQIEKKHCGKFPHTQIAGYRTNTCRALEIARRKKAEGDVAGALKFAKKSQALFSNPQTEGFLATLADVPTSNGTAYASGTSTPSTPNGEGPTPRKPKPSEHKQGRQDTQYTKEQMTVVERVRKCKHHQYYEILELKTEATDSEVKKRYFIAL
jgi:DnaJ homolog subfamily B member 12